MQKTLIPALAMSLTEAVHKDRSGPEAFFHLGVYLKKNVSVDKIKVIQRWGVFVKISDTSNN
jgi:hypothetical protein